MATIKGKWVFKTAPTAPTFVATPDANTTRIVMQEVSLSYKNYQNNTVSANGFYYLYSSSYGLCLACIQPSGSADLIYSFTNKSWMNSYCNAPDFGENPQIVSDEFAEWFAANTTADGGEIITNAVTVTYKDTTIAIDNGQTATLHTAGQKLTEDVVISVPKAETVEDWDGSIEVV